MLVIVMDGTALASFCPAVHDLTFQMRRRQMLGLVTCSTQLDGGKVDEQ
jgi:hypothetical protein